MDALFNSPVAYVIIVLLILALVSFLLSMQQLRIARANTYWRQRRAAGQRGGQLFLISVTLFGIAAALAFFSGFASIAIEGLFDRATPTITDTPMSQTATPTPNMQATIDAAVQATVIALPTSTPVVIDSTVQGTATHSPFGGLLAHDTVTGTPATPRPEAVIQITGVSGGITAERQPDESTSPFDSGIRRLYVFFQFANMNSGTAWTRQLYHNETLIYSRRETWTAGESGASYFFVGVDAGFPPGEYEFRILLAGEVITTFELSING